jgi:DnaJ-class molecular chaperone
MARDYYVVLGVTSKATPDEIRSAYRERVKALHPDRAGVDSAPFLEAQEAYAVLGDPERRTRYDRSVHDRVAVARRRAAESPVDVGPVAPGAAAAEAPVSLFRSFGTHGPSIDALFDRIWSNFFDVHRPKSEAMEPVVVDVPVTVQQARRGGRVDVALPVLTGCHVCGGDGRVGPFSCWRCEGAGRTAVERSVPVSYPPGDWTEYVAEEPLDSLGIRNLYLQVRFRVAGVGL